MDQNRKNIIIKEIIHWKNSRLLPDQYCDFLLSLYTEGNGESITKKLRKQAIYKAILVNILILLLPISLLVIYFTEMSFVLQIVLLTFFIILCLISLYFLKGKGLYVQLTLVIAAILLFLIQIQICTYFGKLNQIYLAFVIVGNCLAWIIIGKKAKLNYFYISGFVGIIVFALLFFR